MNRNCYKLEKDKIIPIMVDVDFPKLPIENNLFDEEITIDTDGIYIDNRIRLIIHKEKDCIEIYSANFQEQCGLCYWKFDLSYDEYKGFKSINEVINKVFIEGAYRDRGFSIATGMNKDYFETKDIIDDML